MSMFSKESKFYAIFNHKCPKCHEGDLFKSSVFDGIYNMYERCPKCNDKHEKEPGYFWGAMYVGYGISAITMLSAFAVCLWLFKMSLLGAYFAVAILILLLMAFVARLSRSIWVNLNQKYDPEAVANFEKKQVQS